MSEKTVLGACPHDCPDTCSMLVTVKDGRATAVRGKAAPLATATLARAFLFYPWMTLAVIARIHWQALRLWRKGVPFFRKPMPPVQETTR